MTDQIKALAASISARKDSVVEPYVILIGAGASLSSGCSSMLRIVDDVVRKYDSTQFDKWEAQVASATSMSPEYGQLMSKEVARFKLDHFYQIWGNVGVDTRFTLLRPHLWEGKIPSRGYADLAYLIKEGYFKVALSTNLDNLLEKSLNNAGCYAPDNFTVIVNGKDKPDEVSYQLNSLPIPFKLVKLHGALESPLSYAFTPEEIFKFEETIRPLLVRYLNQSIIVVGHSMQDRDIDVLFEKEGGEIHYVNPSPPELGSRIDSILKVRAQGSVITGEAAKFDNFFQRLRSYIEGTVGAISIAGHSDKDSGRSIEGFLKNIGYEHELKAHRSRFKNLPTLYVKPTEYSGILKKLEREHVVFIIGEPHLGKTYTAFYMLWEYYQQGYEPLHIRHDRLIALLHQYDGDMRKLLAEVFVGEKNLPRIVHFDDPFGETMERRTDRSNVFARELHTFLKLAREYENLRVVVTTRLNIFREVVGGTHGNEKLGQLEKSIRVHTSYRRDTLLDILHRYTNFYKPRWAADEKIVAALDEQLPNALPAPHNIEFFVRTSEMLTTLEVVLKHVADSKEMIKALADWMGYLPAPEQVFLLLVEITSTANILFPGTAASAMNLESSYLEMLAYLFKRKHLAGIPPAPFEHARNKFDRILVERHDDDGTPMRFDFVHPSYHEAFWYAIQRRRPLHLWWELLKNDVRDIFKDSQNKADIVQLRMIERYGTVDRDLDRLLLLSAESSDVEEQLIALEHMVERIDQFSHLPQFNVCLNSITSSENEEHKLKFLGIVDKNFTQLTPETLDAIPQYLSDKSLTIRRAAEELILPRMEDLPSALIRNDVFNGWKLLRSFLVRANNSRDLDVISALQFESSTSSLAKLFYEFPLEDLQQLLKLISTPKFFKPLVISIRNIGDYILDSPSR